MKQSGNVLFLILIAVALFAALSYAVTQSSSGEGKNANEETLRLEASQIIQYSNSVSTGVLRARLSNDCDYLEISFDHENPSNSCDTSSANIHDNANSPSDCSCHIFHSLGVGATYQAPETQWLDSSKSGESNYGSWLYTFDNKVQHAGTPTENDLVLTLPYVKESYCKAINTLLDIENPSDTPPLESGGFELDPWDGNWDDTPIGVNGPSDGSLESCVESENGDMFIYYKVLLAR